MRLLKITAVILLGLILVTSFIFISTLSPVDKDGEDKTDFTIIAGQPTVDVAKALESQGLIRNSFAFYIYLKFIGGKVLPGIYELSPTFSGSEIAQIISKGKFKTVRITIVEGWRVSQMAAYFEKIGLKNAADFKTKALPYEGYLFPDTYEIRADISEDELIELMRRTFNKKTAELNITPETVILASIIEREAKSDTDRPMISGVYHNRIKRGMRLQADPTVQYAKSEQWTIISTNDYNSVISPYNTYLNDGLPPGPICSPGLASIKAALEPSNHDYLYFFHAKGETHFSKTHDEHRAKVRKYFN